ncbi:E3 ubiquitin-protein ligase RNF213 isoform X1 [Erinaceus europaeus]|uniref:E3 ubiquitin-protein ligase RNF213 isoform X1 n=1 Tax=Erinaceus europaeus TaxID=9365 RepID=A0A1S3WVJ2_ERIEU|nr:E3 ubiquitin-protein ligase RNF213 isoform X1 [Erinaceus europaeus]
MQCPSCPYISREDANFCSNCGQRLRPAAPQKGHGPQLPSAPQEEMKSEQELKEEGGTFASLSSNDWQEIPEESGSWSLQTSKKKRRKMKKQKNSTSTAGEPDSLSPSLSLSLPPSTPCHPSSPTGQDSSPAQLLGGLSPPPGTDTSPLQGGNTAGKTGDSPLQCQPITGQPQGSLTPQDQTPGEGLPEGKEQNSTHPGKGRAVPAEGAGAVTSAQEPESNRDRYTHTTEAQTPGQPTKRPSQGTSEAAGKGSKKGEKSKTEKAKQTLAQDAHLQEWGQEAAASGRTAGAGDKAGRKEKESSMEGKKPEGSSRNSAAAVKTEREQRSQKAEAQEEKGSSLSTGEGVTVYFHAILSKNFSFNPDRHNIFVRGGEELGAAKWKHNVCEMYCSKDLGEHGTLVEGSTIISKQHLDKSIPYKYVIMHDGDSVDYEFIYKDPQIKKEHVNRCLYVRSSLLDSGEWHQYDDIICKRPGTMQKAIEWIKSKKKELVNGKRIAMGVMLDSIFSILQSWNAINVHNFFTQLQQLYAVICVPMVHEGQPLEWTELQYGKKEVQAHLWGHLKQKMAPFLNKNGSSLPEGYPVRSPVSMGLLALFVVEKFQLTLAEEDLASLCCLLCAHTTSSDALKNDLAFILDTPHSWREFLVNLCHQCMKKEMELWVAALPVLHHCMQLSIPVQGPRILPEDTWAALEGLSFSEFREKTQTKKSLLQFMIKKRHLLQLDPFLFQSWFSLLPLSELDSYLREFADDLNRFPTWILDCFLGTHYRFQGLKTILCYNQECITKTLKALLHLLDAHQSRILQASSVQSYLTVCLKLHENICRISKTCMYYEIPALSAKLVCRIIILLQPPVDSAEAQGKETEMKNLIDSIFQATLHVTRTWLQRIFKLGMFQIGSTLKFSYWNEIKIWRQLVEINFPAEYGWKESLLEDLEGRIKQGQPHIQISAWDTVGSDDSVSKCFEKCALETVTSACKSQTSILEQVSYHDWKKFGVLVSAVITKGWPRRAGSFVDDLDETLTYLLTGPDIKHIFKLLGTKDKILENITEEGKKLMAIADSVITKVSSDLQRRTILIGQLELILEHRSQFLSIWELKRKNLSPQEKKLELKGMLDERQEELNFLNKEKTYISSLLKLCGKVEDLIKVDIEKIAEKHAEDLSRKMLKDVLLTIPLPTSFGSLKQDIHYDLSSDIKKMAKKANALKDSHLFQVFWKEEAASLGESEDLVESNAISLEAVHMYLFSPCFKRFMELYKDLRSGEVTLAKVDAVFKDFVHRDDQLASELQLMCHQDKDTTGQWIPERVEQIREYHHLHQAVNSAKVILKVKENLGLNGDFCVLQNLLNFADHFAEFQHEKLTCINRQLICARKLLQDITEPRYRCLDELTRSKEFISWVQETLEGITDLKVFVDLASISAGENDIDVDRVACFHDAVQGYSSLLYKLDSHSGFNELTDQLQELWKALENDQSLPNKLRDSARSLEWLKTVRDSHGSVELSSLSLATAINSRGIYLIQAPAHGQQISPDTVVHLVLPESHGVQEQMREYSLEELKELLNKLMLMSGKREHSNVEVEVFSEVFCGVQRLVQAFIHLYSAGNLLFRAWTAKVQCSPREGLVVLDFHVRMLPQLSEHGPVTELLQAVCRELEAFLQRWQSYVAQKRAQHFYLNYYTAEQLVLLSRELGQQPPSQGALTMLSFVLENCSPRDVAKACGASGSQASASQREKVVEALLGQGGLAAQLQEVLGQSLECMGTFLPTCLDLGVLGRSLECLAKMGGPPVKRRLPKGLQAGRPNLVACGPSELLLATLAIYMQSPEQPLPSYSEVLLCQPDTTFEEVELLLRRCLSPGAPGHRLYCLLFAERLGFEVGCQAERLLQQLCSQPHREDYQLVLLCEGERERGYLPSALSQYKVPVVPQKPLHTLQDYLARHFQVPEEIYSAASVFRDRMCVGIVASKRAGVGKSLYVKRLHEKLRAKFKRNSVSLKVIRLINPQVDETQVLGALLPFLDAHYQNQPVLFHLDVTSAVRLGIEEFLFKLLILQYLADANGKIWLRNPHHLYIVEILEGASALPKRSTKQSARMSEFNFLNIFPKVTCRPPKEVIHLELSPKQRQQEPGMDMEEFRSETFQRPFQYLRRFFQKENLDMFQYRKGSVEGTPGECIQQLLIHCGVMDPSWLELHNFACFLNYQLRDCENSTFCDLEATGDTLRGFKDFVVSFMVLMARDFATPTLHTFDQSPGHHMVTPDGVLEEDLAPFSLRKRWESEPHPYAFFNDDHVTMTFIGFHIQPNLQGGMDAVQPSSHEVLKHNVMTKQLHHALELQRVPFNMDFDQLPRHQKLEKLALALGIQWPLDPDETYELTTDNMLKILAIEMRFRCGIPVIIMGETGCGKTRLIRFLSDLRRGGAHTETLCLVKVHGGTTAQMIHDKVQEAEALALYNKRAHQLDTILFFDEANTTEAISCIKEVLCDRTVDGQPLAEGSGLHIIAACNPYRKHSQEMINRLESAGLGYRVRAEETTDRLGSIPLRQLVYRVHALPPSLIPLVWDFGQLNDASERLYIQQIVQRLASSSMGLQQRKMAVITEVLSASQAFMRGREGECSFVSLRDVERCVKVFQWFYERSPQLLAQLESFLRKSGGGPSDFKRDPVLWSLVLALGVCYHASLEEKVAYRMAISQILPEPYDNGKVILEEITQVQDLFLEGVALRKTIAKNLALKENVFMMVICIELKIPLFLVGKPGSSKSLAKTIVADAMQGQAAHSDLFRSLKQVHLVSFQCSPHSTPQGIISTFRQCARFQQGKDLQQYVSVVVLDEVGLAEDSPKMPLKTLHPLLEDGCIEDDAAPHKKVGFIGISNWALDPAKMNRGIFVSRGAPSKSELIQSAEGICSSEPLVQERVRGYFAPFARAYEDVCERQDKEFFGLRDYYSLIKMLFAVAKATQREPSPQDLAQAVLRNFSGKDDVDALDIFASHVPEARCLGISTMQLIQQNMLGEFQKLPGCSTLEDAESRYLLVLTRNYVALQILQQVLFAGDQQPEIIFGSSFPQDQEYTQICRNINRVKICMETGRTVVLLNLQNLYESLYDALNQYYVYLGGQKYVDLGLGTHRVKCRVHPNFRLVVIEEKDVVYRHFPIPLINRLEKHYLDIHTVLEAWQQEVVKELQHWVDNFIQVKAEHFQTGHRYNPSDIFIGFHADACASLVLQVLEQRVARTPLPEQRQQVVEEAKLLLLACATPDAVVRLRDSSLGGFAAKALSKEYYNQQQHDSFSDFLQAHLGEEHTDQHAVFTEITTFSRLLTSHDADILESEVKAWAPRPSILSLQQFDTEYSFLKEIRNCLKKRAEYKILIIQTDFEDGIHSAQLVASAKYSVINEINKKQGNEGCTFVYFITKLSRMGSGTCYVGFHGGLWQSVHIDDLRRSTVMVSDVTKLQEVTISQLFHPEEGPKEMTRPEPEDSTEDSMETEPAVVELEAAMETGPDPQEEPEMETKGPDTMEKELPELGGCPVLDTTRLLRSCIQGAVGLLRDPQGCRQRNVQRVETLLALLTDEDPSAASFLRVCKLRLHELLRKQEELSFVTMKEWVVRAASNQDALQEAGTFRQALWKRIQAAVTPLLASILSYIDRDSNLELLTRPGLPSWAKDLWMFIFSDRKLLNIPLVTNDARSRNELSSIVVQSYMSLQEHVLGDVPFSWRIKDYLEELCVQAQYITGVEELSGKLVEIFQQTPLGRFLAQLCAEEQQDLLHCYTKDFLLLNMRVATWEELKFLQMALWSCINELKTGKAEDGFSLPWVHLAYQHFRNRLQNFSRIVTIHPQVFQALEGLRNHNLAGGVMSLDVLAALACTEMLTSEMLQPSPQAWLQMVKSLSTPLELLCSDGYLRESRSAVSGLITEVRTHWNLISSIALFVEHVLLGTQSQIPELCPLVTKYVFSLSKCLQEDSDMKTHGPFVVVMKTLHKCKNQASQTLSRFGIQPCPICLGDAQDPVLLPCEHAFCLHCAKSWITMGQMACPYCLTDLPDNYTPRVSLEHRAAIQKHTCFREMCNSFFIDLVSTMCFKDNSPPHKDVVMALLSLLFVQKGHFRDATHRTHEHTKSLSPFDDVVDKSPVIRSVVLKLLLKYSFHDVKDYLQNYLSMLEQKAFITEDRAELYLLFSHCLEDSLHEKMRAFSASEELRHLREETRFLKTCQPRRGGRGRAEEVSVDYLQQMAQLRLCLDRASSFLAELQEGPGKAPAACLPFGSAGG